MVLIFTQLWCYKEKRRPTPRQESTDAEIGIPREPVVTSSHQVVVAAAAADGDDGGETTRLVTAEVTTRSVAPAAAATSSSASGGDASTRTLETDERGDNSSSGDNVSGFVRSRPSPIDLPALATHQQSDPVTGGTAASERSPVPPPSAPPLEEEEEALTIPYAFEQSTALPEERLRQLIDAPRVTQQASSRHSASALNGDYDEESASYNNPAAVQSRPLSVPIFRQFQSGPVDQGSPSAKGLSEALVSPRRPQVRRRNDYVKIKPRSMEVVTTTVENGDGDAAEDDDGGHYSSISDRDRPPQPATNEGGIMAAVDVHNEMHFADEDASDQEVVASPTRAPPSETAL